MVQAALPLIHLCELEYSFALGDGGRFRRGWKAEGLVARIGRYGWCVLALIGLGVPAVVAQEGPAAQDEKVVTLHVYTNLVQTAALVLSPDHRPLAPIAEGRFFVSLDGGPPFRVTHARLEGDDPISLAILLDLTQPFPDLMKTIDGAIAGLAPLSLHPRDRVSVYAQDCVLSRWSADAPAEPASLQQAVALALGEWRARGRTRLNHCQDRSSLRDSLIKMTQALSEEPGHRVILVVTDGIDRGSRSPWNAVRLSAQSSGVAIFGLSETVLESGLTQAEAQSENLFVSSCESSGGMVLTTNVKGLAKQLEDFVAMLRGRYIVEFPHALATTPEDHNMDITVEKSNPFIRATGIRVPVDDPAILSDPTTVLTDPAKTPVLGKRKAMPPN